MNFNVKVILHSNRVQLKSTLKLSFSLRTMKGKVLHLIYELKFRDRQKLHVDKSFEQRIKDDS